MDTDGANPIVKNKTKKHEILWAWLTKARVKPTTLFHGVVIVHVSCMECKSCKDKTATLPDEVKGTHTCQC